MNTLTRFPVLLAAVLPAIVWAWDTNDSEEGWQSAYLSGSLETAEPNEHRQLSEMAWRQLGLDQVMPLDQRGPTVVDLNASVFRHATNRTDQQVGDLEATEYLEERQLPHPVGFSGLPDFSYTIYDWINKNSEDPCPVLPQDAENPELCHKFRGWMGALNSNHFGTQASQAYRRYHEIALQLAVRARRLRERITRFETSADYQRHLPMLKEMEVEALVFESVGQHYLQDRWSVGHMFERWNGADYAQLQNKGFWFNFVVGIATGLLHGSQGVTGQFDMMSSPMIIGGKVSPAKWVYESSLNTPHPGVGDYRLADMKNGPGGSFQGQPLGIQSQMSAMMACLEGGWSEVVAAFGTSHTNPATYGAHEFPLRELIEVHPSCFEAWATDDAVLKGMFDDLWNSVIVPSPDSTDSSQAVGQEILQEIVSRMPKLDAGNVPGWEDFSGHDLRDAYFQLRLNSVAIAARARAWMIQAKQTGLRLDQSAALSRGFLGPFGDALEGDASLYGIAGWIEPANLDLLDDRSAIGRDKNSIYGFFSLSHIDHWCQHSESLFVDNGLRGTSPNTLEACVFAASKMYSGTTLWYEGRQSEKPATRSACEVNDITRAPGNDDIPFWLAPGYVGGNTSGEQSPERVTNGVYQSIVNWCRRVPVLNLREGADGRLDKEDIVAIGSVDEAITVTGLNLGARREDVPVQAVILQSGDNEGHAAEIETWTPTEISFRAPARYFDDGDYRIRVVRADGVDSVGRFVLRLRSDASGIDPARYEQDRPDIEPGMCTAEQLGDFRTSPNYGEDSYTRELKRLERLQAEMESILEEALAAADREQVKLDALAEQRSQRQQTLTSLRSGLVDLDALFRGSEPELFQQIEKLRELVEAVQGYSDADSRANQATLAESRARLAEYEDDLSLARSDWDQGAGRDATLENTELTAAMDEEVVEIEELRWAIRRQQMTVFDSLEAARDDAGKAEAAAQRVASFKNNAPIFLRQQIPPIVTSISAENGFRQDWVTSTDERERLQQRVRVVESHIRASRDLKHGAEYMLRRAEEALIASTQNWLALNDEYADRIYGEAWLNIGLELADSYENIFGLDSPRAVAGKAALPYLVASEAVFRVGDALFGERPSFPEPKLARELLQARESMTDQIPASSAQTRALHIYPSTFGGSDQDLPSLPVRDGAGYPGISTTVQGRVWNSLDPRDMGNLKEHFKSQLQNAIENLGESSVVAAWSNKQLWEHTALELQGLASNLSQDDPLRRATEYVYDFAGQRRELAGDSLRAMFTNGTVKRELKKLGLGALTSIAKDAIKTTLKDSITNTVREGRLETYLDMFGEELAYFSHQRDYYFFSAVRQQENAKIEALEELREDYVRQLDRIDEGRQLSPPLQQTQQFEGGTYTLHIEFSIPVEDAKAVVVGDTRNSEVAMRLNGERTAADMELDLDALDIDGDVVRLQVSANARLSKKALDGDPHTVACYSADEKWKNYELRPYVIRLQIARSADGTGERIDFISLEYNEIPETECPTCRQEGRGKVDFKFEWASSEPAPVYSVKLFKGRRIISGHDGFLMPGTYVAAFDSGTSAFRQEFDVRPGQAARVTVRPGGIRISYPTPGDSAGNPVFEIFDQGGASSPVVLGAISGQITYVPPGIYRIEMAEVAGGGMQAAGVSRDNVVVGAGQVVDVEF